MRCPVCGHPESRVLESRPTEDGAVIRRRRECDACAERFTTYEKVQPARLMVVKKDGRREPFDPQKIFEGMVVACTKRPVSMQSIERAVAGIERELRNRPEREVPTREVGELVMERLRSLDEIAYVRFASVYLGFEDLRRFRDELDRLMGAGAQASAAGDAMDGAENAESGVAGAARGAGGADGEGRVSPPD